MARTFTEGLKNAYLAIQGSRRFKTQEETADLQRQLLRAKIGEMTNPVQVPGYTRAGSKYLRTEALPRSLAPEQKSLYEARTKSLTPEYQAQVASAKTKAGLEAATSLKQDGQYPVGSTYNTATGGFNIPLNPEYTESEARTAGTIPILDESVKNFNNLIDQGVLEGSDPSENAVKSLVVDSGKAPLTFGHSGLSGLQSELNRIKANTMFSEGGKTLSKTEQAILENLFSVSGKDRARIKRDIGEGIRKYHEFISAKKQGMAGYNPNQSSQGYKVGQRITANGKNYEVIGGDPNDPDVREIQ